MSTENPVVQASGAPVTQTLGEQQEKDDQLDRIWSQGVLGTVVARRQVLEYV